MLLIASYLVAIIPRAKLRETQEHVARVRCSTLAHCVPRMEPSINYPMRCDCRRMIYDEIYVIFLSLGITKYDINFNLEYFNWKLAFTLCMVSL